MISHSVVLTIEGPDANNHHLELPVFAEKVAQFNRVLAGSIKSDEQVDVVVNIVRLDHSSPATVECQPTLNRVPYIPTVEGLEQKLACIDSENADGVDDRFLSAVEKLAESTPRKIAWSTITTIKDNMEDRRVFKLDDTFRAKLVNARNEEYTETSTIDGMLKEINVHSKPHTCKIYDAGSFSTAIRCEFPDALLKQVRQALGSGVFVSGEFFYRPKTSIPYKISLHEIEILPSSEKLPSLRDLKGIAPGLTHNKPAEEFVRGLRKQWNEN